MAAREGADDEVQHVLDVGRGGQAQACGDRAAGDDQVGDLLAFDVDDERPGAIAAHDLEEVPVEHQPVVLRGSWPRLGARRGEVAGPRREQPDTGDSGPLERAVLGFPGLGAERVGRVAERDLPAGGRAHEHADRDAVDALVGELEI